MPLLLHRSPFADTSADPADAQSLDKFHQSNNSDAAAPEYQKLFGSVNATTSSADMRGRVTAWDVFS